MEPLPQIEKTHETGTLVACSVYDEAVGCYFQPFFARSRAEAIRSFRDSVNQEGHPFNNHPKDFSLHVLAEWNENDGGFRPLPAFDNLGSALDYVVPPESLPGQMPLQ